MDFAIDVFLISVAIGIYAVFVGLFLWLLDGWIPAPFLIVCSILFGLFALASFGFAAIVALAVVGAFVAALAN